jgi:hypothetical protein
VAEGTYRLPAQLDLTNAVTVYSFGDRANTVIEADGTHRCVYLNDPEAVLDGFTVKGGRAVQGGGVYLDGGGTVRDCILVGNHADSEGGAVYLDEGGIVEHCFVTNNTARNRAGGVYGNRAGIVRNSTFMNNRTDRYDGGGAMLTVGAVMEDCLLIHNSAGDDGGGVQCGDNGGPDGGRVRRCVFQGNTAGDKGGGAFCWQGSVVEDCLFYENTANLGGGFGCRDGGTLRNGTVVLNVALSRGGGLWSEDGGSSWNTIVVGNTAPESRNVHAQGTAHTYGYCCTGPVAPGPGNISGNPLFADVDGEDFRLTAVSPCVDAGTNRPGPVVDLAGVPRPLDGNDDGSPREDIGAHEFAYSQADTDGDGMGDAAEVTAGTSPVDDEDYLRIAGVSAGHPFSLFWKTVEDRRYTVQTTTNLATPWTNVSDGAFTDMPGTGSWVFYTNGAYAGTPRFYRIGVTGPDGLE